MYKICPTSKFNAQCDKEIFGILSLGYIRGLFNNDCDSRSETFVIKN